MAKKQVIEIHISEFTTKEMMDEFTKGIKTYSEEFSKIVDRCERTKSAAEKVAESRRLSRIIDDVAAAIGAIDERLGPKAFLGCCSVSDMYSGFTRLPEETLKKMRDLLDDEMKRYIKLLNE